jgi:hypothetical protein
VLLGTAARHFFENVIRQELLAGREQLPLLESNVVVQTLREGARGASVARTGSLDAATQEGMIFSSPVGKGRRPTAPESRQQQVLLDPEVRLELVGKTPPEFSSVGLRPGALVLDQ